MSKILSGYRKVIRLSDDLNNMKKRKKAFCAIAIIYLRISILFINELSMCKKLIKCEQIHFYDYL